MHEKHSRAFGPSYLRLLLPAPLGANFSMATVQPVRRTPSPSRRGALRTGQGTSFIRLRLHSLLGIVPIGAFLLEHLLSNFEALKGPMAYGEQVKFLNSLPLVRVLEWVVHLPAHSLSRHLRRLHLAARQVEHRVLPVGGELDVPGAALYRSDRICVHHSARD